MPAKSKKCEPKKEEVEEEEESQEMEGDAEQDSEKFVAPPLGIKCKAVLI
jgi:hypothetical protein